MKKIIFLSVAGALCAGCSNDSAKIDTLDKKLDAVIQRQDTICSNEVILAGNQAALSARFDVLNKQVAMLPDYNALNGMAFYYHTNALDILQDHIDTKALLIDNLAQMIKGVSDENTLISKQISSLKSSIETHGQPN